MIGPTLGSYIEKNLPDNSYTSISLRGEINYGKFFKKWTLSFGGYMTAFSISKTNSNDFRFLGVNLRAARNIFCSEDGNWCVDGTVGWYYTTMFVENDTFGFKNMNGP